MIVTAGKTNVSAYFYIVGDSSHASPGEPVTGLLYSDIETGGSASYMRQGAARTDLTLVTQTAAGAHTDGGFVQVDATNMPGVYRCDYPDAAFATGVDEVVLSIVVASANNAIAAPIKCQIADFDLRTASPVVASVTGAVGSVTGAVGSVTGAVASVTGNVGGNVTGSVGSVASGGITAASIAADAIGASELAADAVAEIADQVWDEARSGHVTDGSFGQAFVGARIGTAQSATASTIVLAAGETFAADELNGAQVHILSASTGAGQTRYIDDYAASVADTADISPDWTTTPTGTIVYQIFPSAPVSTGNPPDVNVVSVADTAQTGGDLAALITTVDTVVDGIQTDLSNGTDGLGAIKTDTAAILVDTAEIGAAGAGLTALATQGSVDTIDTNVDTLLTRIPAALFSGITSLAEWLGLMAGAQTANATALTEIKATGAGSGTYDESTDSMEAIAGAGGGGAPTVTQIRQEMDANSTQLAAILADTNELQTDDVPGLIAALNDPTAAAVADAVLDEALAGHVTAGTLGKAVADIETDVTSIETRLPDALESGRIAATTGSVSNAAIRDGILDRALSSHTTAGTVGKAISDTLADTAELQADDVPGLIAALNDLSSAESQTAAAAAITAAFGITTSTVNDASATTTGFTVTADVSTDIRLGVLRFTDGALAGESRLVTHTGTTIAVVQPTSVPAGLATVGPFSAAVANGVAYTFRPL